jgi:hypothetical protein
MAPYPQIYAVCIECGGDANSLFLKSCYINRESFKRFVAWLGFTNKRRKVEFPKKEDLLRGFWGFIKCDGELLNSLNTRLIK